MPVKKGGAKYTEFFCNFYVFLRIEHGVRTGSIAEKAKKTRTETKKISYEKITAKIGKTGVAATYNTIWIFVSGTFFAAVKK